MCVSVLFIVDGDLDRPLLHSQGLPLLRKLAAQGLKCHILSFESNPGSLSTELWSDLQTHGIRWLPVILRGSSQNQRGLMILTGLWTAFRVIRHERILLLHCRSYRPGLMGLLLKRLTGVGFLFDMRGFLIDELVADGRWRVGSLKYKLGKFFERWLVLGADAITTTSPQFSTAVRSLPYFPSEATNRVISIPNNVDTNKFTLSKDQRQTFRQKLGWQQRYVALFAGVANRYQRSYSDIFRFFGALKANEPRALLALLVYDEVDLLREAARAFGLDDSDLFFAQVPPAQMPNYLNAADVGIAFFRLASFAHSIASPVKFAEYLACGLPVAINAGVGDTERIIRTYRVGITIDTDEIDKAESSVAELLRLSADPDLSARCRLAAEKELSLDLAVERYRQVYETVASKAQSRGR